MFANGTKLEVNKDFNGIAEICGLYPKGQNNYGEDHQKIMINGMSLIIPESLISTLFKELSPYVQVQEEIVDAVVVKPKKVVPKKTVKKLTKKPGY